MIYRFIIKLILSVIIILVGFVSNLRSQNAHLRVSCADSLNTDFPKSVSFADYQAIKSYCSTLIAEYKTAGYIAASVDKLVKSSDTTYADLYLGKLYRISSFNIPQIASLQLRMLNLNAQKITGKPFSQSLLNELSQKILLYYAEQGFPFAEATPTVNFPAPGKAEVEYSIIKNTKVYYNEIFLKGSGKISEKYIYGKLQIKPGKPYNESRVQQISDNISTVPFLLEIRKSSLEFYENKADLYLYLKPKKSNRFNGIVGFIPDSLNDYKLDITGNLQFDLYNSFNRGEYISLEWKRNREKSQLLQTEFIYPYPLGYNIELSSMVLLDKTDSLHFDVEYAVGTNYLFGKNSKLTLSYRMKNSSVTGQSELADLSDTKRSVFSIGYSKQHIDYAPNPYSGYAFSLLVGAGKRQYKEESAELYTLDLAADWYLPLYKRLIIFSKLNIKGQLSQTPLFDNELYKFGGIRTMRGFDEDYFNVQHYAVYTAEFRYLYDTNAAAYFFSDIGYYTKNKMPGDFVWGFGPGVNIDTKAGIFSFNYALGKTMGNPILFSQSKIHIAYINRF
ncbi:MAG: ShlB/FhaC/HecB family hemolysin secretion/activation protein [Bacteroidota bacterium]|nr:ShlB/FhaC/HecB family hemolysin secretion/activation protein [Bacteroidota bacterium]